MPRPAPWRLDPARYPRREEVQTRFQDLDPMGHLNNVAFAAMFEHARVQFNQRAGRMNQAEGFRAVVARNEIHYLAEGSYPEPVTIATGIGRLGNRSWEMVAVMIQSGRPIATCDSTIVMTHPRDGGIPDGFRAKLEEMLVRAD